MKLSEAQLRALDILKRQGHVSTDDGVGVAVATLRSLAAKGLGTYTVLIEQGAAKPTLQA